MALVDPENHHPSLVTEKAPTVLGKTERDPPFENQTSTKVLGCPRRRQYLGARKGRRTGAAIRVGRWPHRSRAVGRGSAEHVGSGGGPRVQESHLRWQYRATPPSGEASHLGYEKLDRKRKRLTPGRLPKRPGTRSPRTYPPSRRRKRVRRDSAHRVISRFFT